MNVIMKLKKRKRQTVQRAEMVVPLKDRTLQLVWNLGMKPEHLELEWVEVPRE